ncbi:TIGR03905 family TSCPD domain-containing protein [bacterium]|nr:TIGR03905 family TSCPD domain-containing protein [bacterium]
MSEINIKEENGIDIIQFIPKGVCSKMMQIKIKDERVIDAEFIGGCAGNLSGIKMLIQGMHISEIVEKLSGLPCGSRKTSCPDQLAQGIKAYIDEKQKVHS